MKAEDKAVVLAIAVLVLMVVTAIATIGYESYQDELTTRLCIERGMQYVDGDCIPR